MLACLLSALGADHHDPHVAPVAQEVLCAAPSQRFARRNGISSVTGCVHVVHHFFMPASQTWDFLAMMISHHEGAVENPRLVLIHAKTR
jgi:uncharacterized protein (DUF305 family)